MKYYQLALLAGAFLISSCDKEIDRAVAFEGSYIAPSSYSDYDRVKVTKVDKQTVSLQYSLKDSAQFLLIAEAEFTSDSSLSFSTQSSIGSGTTKYDVKGTALIYSNRLIINAKAENPNNSLDFYNAPFDGNK